MTTPHHHRRKPERDQPVFFYKPNQSYGIFCQWYPSVFSVNNADITSLVGSHIACDAPQEHTEFNCAEQFMMYCKAAKFNDERRQHAILKAVEPRTQKKIGRDVDGFCEESWSDVKSRIVKLGSYAKFTQNELLRSWLLGTGNRELVEASGRDRVWGIGFSVTTEQEARVALENREHWGENLLGNALMAARESIRRERDASGKGE